MSHSLVIQTREEKEYFLILEFDFLVFYFIHCELCIYVKRLRILSKYFLLQLTWRPEEMKQLRYICKDMAFPVTEILGRAIFVLHSKEDFWFWFFWRKCFF